MLNKGVTLYTYQHIIIRKCVFKFICHHSRFSNFKFVNFMIKDDTYSM